MSGGMTPAEIRKARTSCRYRKLRRQRLAKDPTCRPCEKAGFTVEAVELDHIVPVYRDSSRFWELLNPEVTQVICRACHEAKSAAENRSETPERAAWRERLEGMA